jgi:hypothetical protein
MSDVSGVVVLGFGPQPMDFFSKCMKITGTQSEIDTDVARMAGANFAVGSRSGLEALRARIEAGAIAQQKKETPHLSADVIAWLANGRRGVSSNTIFTVLTGVDALAGSQASHPHDPSDLDRCLCLLDAVPRLHLEIHKMAHVSPEWAALVARWADITKSHIEEVGLGWTKAKTAPKTYALMRSILESI